MLSAISLGVFCRCAPSTSAIMRSRKVSPGFDVIRTLIQSREHLGAAGDGAAVAADSRITGALSPVIADSSTLAMPSMTSPSPGIRSPGSQITTSPLRKRGAGPSPRCPPRSRRAIVSVLVLRSVSACALPRPSAMASAKLANSTVNHSQSVIWHVEADAAGVRRRHRAPAGRW